MKLLTAQQMRDLDRRAMAEIGIPGIVLMENAGRAAASMLMQEFSDRFPGPVLVLCGKGNNGGDGYVVSRCLRDRGWRVRTLVLARREQIGGDAGTQLDILLACGAQVDFVSTQEALNQALDSSGRRTILVDALLGTGGRGPARGLIASAIDWINDREASVFSLDIPSGLDATSGRIEGPAVMADFTATFAAAKLGMATTPGSLHAGRVQVLDIGIPAALMNQDFPARLVTEAVASGMLPGRPASGHKGSFGHLLVWAGAPGTTGAAILCGSAGLRAGAGLVTVALAETLCAQLSSYRPELMSASLPEGSTSRVAKILSGHLQGKTALVAGPGLGTTPRTQDLLSCILPECMLPMVLDADALNILSLQPGLLRALAGRPVVLTPHPGEMARLMGSTAEEIQRCRIEASRDFARTHQVTVLLKGARSVIAEPDGRLSIIDSGNPALATAGTGDVLAGIIGSLLCQGLGAGNAAVLGAWLHGVCADRWAARRGQAGMYAGDLLEELPPARQQLFERGSPDA